MTPIDSFKNRLLAAPIQMQYNNRFKKPVCRLSYEPEDLYWKLKANYYRSLGFKVSVDTSPIMK